MFKRLLTFARPAATLLVVPIYHQRTKNIILGDSTILPEQRPHRTILSCWTILGHLGPEHLDSRIDSMRAVFKWARAQGYEGVELSVGDLWEYFYDRSVSWKEVAEDMKKESQRSGIPVVGSLWHISDAGFGRRERDLDWTDPDFEEVARERLAIDKSVGCEYVTFQLSLPEWHQNTGGMYRHDDAYIAQMAQRIKKLQNLVFEAGMNFYIETHICRISEDLEGFVKIMEHPECPYFEINADFSHYLYRGWTKGEWIEKIKARVGHTHQRNCREHGDLSANCPNPEADWDNKGMTYSAFSFFEPVLKCGLSSRCIVGETGPYHLVQDQMGEDAKMVPMYKKMAEYADEKGSFEFTNPFGKQSSSSFRSSVA